jgi:hypothetical protein
MIVRMKIFLITAVLLFCWQAGFALESPPPPVSENDTLWIDSISTHSGQKAVLALIFANDQPVHGFDIPLIYSNPDIIIDSVSYEGSRISGLLTPISSIDPVNRTIRIGGFSLDANEIPAGKGLWASIYLTIPPAFPQGTVVFDSTLIKTFSLVFVDQNDDDFVPQFERGLVTNSYSPAVADSVWIDIYDVMEGEALTIDINQFNESPLRMFSVPLSFHSDNLIIDSISFVGTRGASASSKTRDIDNTNKKLLIDLQYPETKLLGSGTGVLARLYCRTLENGNTPIVFFDTTIADDTHFRAQLGIADNLYYVYPSFTRGLVSIEITTDVDDEPGPSLPLTFALNQNTPNPFNPTTAISFDLPRTTHARVEVFNILGQKVKTLLDKQLPAGSFSVTFDGRGDDDRPLASGVYLYRLRAEGRTLSRKMLLLK